MLAVRWRVISLAVLTALGTLALVAGRGLAQEARPLPPQAVAPQAVAPKTVALELVLAVDVSASVDAREYALQRDGIVAAFRDRRVTATIESLGGQGLAVALVQWAASWEQALVVDWTLVSDRADALGFAGLVAGSPRVFAGEGTSLSQALHFASQVLAASGFRGQRRVIDVSGDGRNNSGPAPTAARDGLIAQGVTINGLAVLGQDPMLGLYFRRNVMGGTAAFVVTAADYSDYADAIRNKLLRELQPPLASTPGRQHQDVMLLDAGVHEGLHELALEQQEGDE